MEYIGAVASSNDDKTSSASTLTLAIYNLSECEAWNVKDGL